MAVFNLTIHWIASDIKNFKKKVDMWYPFDIPCYSMKRTALLDPVPIRFSEDTKNRVNRAAKKFRIKPAQIVRHAVEKQLLQWDRTGQMVIEASSEDGR